MLCNRLKIESKENPFIMDPVLSKRSRDAPIRWINWTHISFWNNLEDKTTIRLSFVGCWENINHYPISVAYWTTFLLFLLHLHDLFSQYKKQRSSYLNWKAPAQWTCSIENRSAELTVFTQLLTYQEDVTQLSRSVRHCVHCSERLEIGPAAHLLILLVLLM